MTNRTLGEHLRDAHSVDPELLDKISDMGARFLHEGAHSKGNEPDEATPTHIASGS